MHCAKHLLVGKPTNPKMWSESEFHDHIKREGMNIRESIICRVTTSYTRKLPLVETPHPYYEWFRSLKSKFFIQEVSPLYIRVK